LVPRVLVVGSINMDLIVQCPRAPRAGQTLHGTAFTTAGGGKGANQAIACARLGARTRMVGRVGNDAFGAELRENLAAAGVDTTAISADPEAATGVALIVVEETGENRIVVVSGANGRVDEQEVARAEALLGEADVVVMALEVPLSVVKAVAMLARERGVRCLLDAGAATTEVVDLGLPALVSILSPNESEAEALTGIRVDDLEGARRAARRLREMGAKEVVLKLGAQGSYWLGDEGEAHVPAFPITPVDTTAAGDAFTGCLAVELARGRPLPEAMERANAAGALACLRLGAQPSLPGGAEVEAFLAEAEKG